MTFCRDCISEPEKVVGIVGFVLAHMVKNKNSLIETFETGTYVIDPSDHENDV